METTFIDLDRLSRLADHISVAATEIADTRCGELDPDAMPGSAVSVSATLAPIKGQIRDVAENLRQWAVAARTSVDAFERADTANADRFPLR